MQVRLIAFLIALGATAASAVDIMTCGQFLDPGEVGILTQDLNCGSSTNGAFLSRGATLRLNGHVLTSAAPLGLAAVDCFDRCNVLGPGEIVGGAIAVAGSGRILVAGGVDIHGAGVGVRGPIPGSTIVAIDVTIHDNTSTALQAQSVRAVNVSVTDNAGLGIRASRAQMTDSTITGNADIGIAVERARLRNSTATGNDGSGAGVDLSTSRRPRLHASTCGKSQVAGQPPGTTWGVCTND
jgi:hypothetical protein